MQEKYDIPKDFLTYNFNGWRLEKVLSKSAFGFTFKATKSNQVAALKTVFNEELDSKISQEIEILKILNREVKYFPKLQDHFQIHEEKSWVALEYIEGINLNELIKKNGPFSVNDWFDFSSSLFQILVTLHSYDIIHQDIKPTNIIVSGKKIYLIDFGLSTVLNSKLRRDESDFGYSSEMWAGTPEFASPEHYSEEHVPAMDIFSAASTLVFAAKGRSPFSAKSNSEWMDAIGKRAPDLSDLTPNQIRYLNPLFVKNKSDRPDANQAKLSAEQFIELINRNVKDIQPTNWPYFEDLRQLAGQIPDINSDLYVNVNSSLSKKFMKLFPKKFIIKFILLAFTSILLFVGIFRYINMDKPGPYGVFDDKSTIGFDESNLKPATLELRLICENLINEKKFKEAYSFCESASLQGDAVSMFDLVTVITELDESPDFTDKNKQSILQNLTKSYDLGFSDAGFSLAYFKAIFTPNEIEEAIKIYNLSWDKNPDLGSFEGLGYLNYKVGNLDEAEELFIKEIQLNDPDTIYTSYESLGILYYEQKRWTDSKKYLELASSGGRNDARYYLAEIIRLIDNDLSEACSLYKSISELNEDANLANTKYCEGLRFSFPVSQNVLVGSLFGRPYLGDDLFWRIPLSVGGEDLVDFSGIQFRDISGKIEWSNIPFKIEKGDIQTNALVDSFFFVTLFNKDFCPEFRVVLEDSAEVKKIWSKPNSFCTN